MKSYQRGHLKFDLASVELILNLLQAESFGLHHDEQSEEEGDATENAEEPEGAVTSDSYL